MCMLSWTIRGNPALRNELFTGVTFQLKISLRVNISDTNTGQLYFCLSSESKEIREWTKLSGETVFRSFVPRCTITRSALLVSFATCFEAKSTVPHAWTVTNMSGEKTLKVNIFPIGVNQNQEAFLSIRARGCRCLLGINIGPRFLFCRAVFTSERVRVSKISGLHAINRVYPKSNIFINIDVIVIAVVVSDAVVVVVIVVAVVDVVDVVTAAVFVFVVSLTTDDVPFQTVGVRWLNYLAPFFRLWLLRWLYTIQGAYLEVGVFIVYSLHQTTMTFATVAEMILVNGFGSFNSLF